MDLAFSDDQRALRDLARQIFETMCTDARLRQIEASSERFDPELWSELARANLLGAGLSEELGGIGGGISAIAIVLEEAGRVTAPVPLWSGFMAASNEQDPERVRAFIAGRERLAYDPGDEVDPRALAGVCAEQLGVSERALEMTATYTAQREQFGKPLGAFQAVQQRAADAYIDVAAMRWTMWEALWRLDEGLPADEHVEIAKVWAAEGGARVLAATQHLHGGMGVDMDYPLHRYTRATRDLELRLGGAGEHLQRLADRLAT